MSHVTHIHTLGETYNGEWLNSRMSGRGKYTYQDGSYYEGEYLVHILKSYSIAHVWGGSD